MFPKNIFKSAYFSFIQIAPLFKDISLLIHTYWNVRHPEERGNQACGEQYLQQVKYPPSADPPNTLVEPPLPHDELIIRKYYQLMMNKSFISITNF